MTIEDEEVIIPPIGRPKGRKSTEQKQREYREKSRERASKYNRQYREKNKLKIKKVKHDHYIRTMKRVKQDRMLRYHNDPEWREQVKAYNRERMRRIRAKEKLNSKEGAEE